MFRIHPKGTGVVCINPHGIEPHQFVTEYLGELYPAYRWCERMDVVEQAQQTFALKPTLPDFYNILLERPRQDPDGYGMSAVHSCACCVYDVSMMIVVIIDDADDDCGGDSDHDVLLEQQASCMWMPRSGPTWAAAALTHAMPTARPLWSRGMASWLLL